MYIIYIYIYINIYIYIIHIYNCVSLCGLLGCTFFSDSLGAGGLLKLLF